MLRLALILLALALPARAEVVVAGLSQKQISISTNFDGSELLIFGAVKRENEIDRNSELGVIITVAGPKQSIMVRRKEKWGPIWVNRAAVEIDAAPSFYAVATSAPFNTLLSDTEDLRRKVSITRAIRSVGAPSDIHDSSEFTDALIRVRRANDLFQIKETTVTLAENTLFNTSISLPANLVEGNYTVRILLTRNRRVVNDFDTAIYVKKVGLERFLYNLAYEQPFLYGLLSLAIAIAAGWGASAVFRYIRT